MGAVDRAIAWHVGALAIRLELGVPEAITDIRRLSAHRAALGPERFTDLLTEAVGDAGQAEFVMSLLDQADAAAEADNADSAE